VHNILYIFDNAKKKILLRMCLLEGGGEGRGEGRGEGGGEAGMPFRKNVK